MSTLGFDSDCHVDERQRTARRRPSATVWPSATSPTACRTARTRPTATRTSTTSRSIRRSSRRNRATRPSSTSIAGNRSRWSNSSTRPATSSTSQPPALTPEWGAVAPFSLTDADKITYFRDGFGYNVYHDPGPPPHVRGTLRRHLQVGLRARRGLVGSPRPGRRRDDRHLAGEHRQRRSRCRPRSTSIPDFYDTLNGGDGGPGTTSTRRPAHRTSRRSCRAATTRACSRSSGPMVRPPRRRRVTGSRSSTR